jgi:3-phosphoshikimate 1-carboxyvinyltransferase
MSLAVIDGDSKIVCDNSIKNKIYFKQTLAVMHDFGVEVELCDDGVIIKGNQTYFPKTQITVEGDYTASSFLLGANLLGADIEIMGLNEDSVQTDKNIETHLSSFSKKGTVFNLSSSPDLAYPLTAVACFSPSNTTIKGINFSGKEGECFSALITALNKLGASIKLENEEVIIEGKKTLKGGAIVDSFGDSRIALALSIASSFAQEPTTILSAHAVNKLYPNFYNDFKTLGGTCQAF